MTALDRAFIKAYAAKNAVAFHHGTPMPAASEATPAAAPVATRPAFEYRPTSATVPPPSASRISVLAALEQPFPSISTTPRSPFQDGFGLLSPTSPFDAKCASSGAAGSATDRMKMGTGTASSNGFSGATPQGLAEPVPVFTNPIVDPAAAASKTTLPPAAAPPPVDSHAERVSPGTTTLRPAWQMEQFSWPKMCRRLFAQAETELDRLADALLAAAERGQKVLAVAGWHYGEGATTLTLCAARRLAQRGIRPVLVDADLERPRLARRLGVQPQAGWNQSPPLWATALAELIVTATADNLALAPACEPSEGGRSNGDRSSLTDFLQSLRPHYDLVLVDLGPLEDLGVGYGSAGRDALGGLDGLVLVRDQRLTTQQQLEEIQAQLTSARIAVAGIIENFVDR